MTLIIAGSLLVDLKSMSLNNAVARALLDPDATTIQHGNHLAYRRSDHMLSWCPAGRTQEYGDDGRWRRAGRQEGRPARSARKFLTPEAQGQIDEKSFADFAELLRGAAQHDEGEFVLVDGEEIAYWYHEDNYAYDQGSLSNSCMRYPSCQRYLRIYTENPNQVRMLIQRDDSDMLIGRALVWQTKQGIFMDRVYGHSHTMRAFARYADDNGWMRRRTNGFGNELDVVLPDGDEVVMGLEVELSSWNFADYPYADTLKYLDRSTGKLANYHHKTANALLQTTGGSYQRIGAAYPGYRGPDNASFEWSVSDLTSCYQCGNYVSPDVATRIGRNDFCANCAPIASQPCGNCQQLLGSTTSRTWPLVGESQWCMACWSNHGGVCGYCHRRVAVTDLAPYHHQDWARPHSCCPDCVQGLQDNPDHSPWDTHDDDETEDDDAF